jgi:hypothetical protein
VLGPGRVPGPRRAACTRGIAQEPITLSLTLQLSVNCACEIDQQDRMQNHQLSLSASS